MAGCRDSVTPKAKWPEILVVASALLVALLSARPYAGGWNDGSRLATIESLVDRHSLSIDDSIFVNVPFPGDPSSPIPYLPDSGSLAHSGTGDKLFIRGHFYSDKSPVPAVLLAAWYQLLQWATGLLARERPDCFCYAMTVASSGLAFVAAVWCIFRLSRRAGLSAMQCVGLAASVGLATFAPTYTRSINNHALQLGTVALLLLGLVHLGDESSKERARPVLLAGLGTLAGLCYTIDLGAGPVFLLCTTGLVAFRCRRWKPIAIFLGGALPWLALHHALNYAVGGTIKPANAVPEYFQWPGCTFNEQNMTGGWNHPSIGQFVVYFLALMEGKKGFLGHNLPLFLTLPALVVLCRSRSYEFPEAVFAFTCCIGAWLVYALASNNYAGECCSIRWFVPLLAPGYFILIELLRRNNRFWGAFLILSAWGTVLGIIMWSKGPWFGRMMPFYWPIQAGAAITLVLDHWVTEKPRYKGEFGLSGARQPKGRAA